MSKNEFNAAVDYDIVFEMNENPLDLLVVKREYKRDDNSSEAIMNNMILDNREMNELLLKSIGEFDEMGKTLDKVNNDLDNVAFRCSIVDAKLEALSSKLDLVIENLESVTRNVENKSK